VKSKTEIAEVSFTVVNHPPKSDWEKLFTRPLIDYSSLEETVRNVLEKVKEEGDMALFELTKKFDNVSLENLSVTGKEIAEAVSTLDPKLKKAIQTARLNIEKFHKAQLQVPGPMETTPGVKCWQKSIPIEKVGLYIPGGSAPLFSTVLMLGIPAVLAGCKEITLCTPPDTEGKINPAILFTANLIGIEKIFKVGGSQAIAAMAYGTETIPKIFKIFGPGNQFVSMAKELVSRQGTAIDMVAGPSEVAIMADETSNPEFIAADLLSQAEHGPDSQVLLFTTSENIVKQSIKEVKAQLDQLPRKEIATQALASARFIVATDDDNMVEMVNKYAPEHLIICTENYLQLSERITAAGSVFLGPHTPESAGDYASGTNHTLPTNGYARTQGGLNMDNFVKKVTFQEISEYGIFNIGSAIEIMAEAEKLNAHKTAVSKRLKRLLDNFGNDVQHK